MPLLRVQKESLVAKLTEELKDSRITLVFTYSGLKMKDNNKLRDSVFNEGAKIKMISNNLLRLILKNIGQEFEIPQKTLALAYGFKDEVTAAKTLVDFAKETQSLEVLGGWVDGNFFDASKIKTLSVLLSKEVLQTQLVGHLVGLIGSLVYSLNYPLQKFVYVLSAAEDKISKPNRG